MAADDSDPWAEEDELPAAARAAREDPRVLAALAELFRRNCHGATDQHRALAAEALAAEALQRLLDPDTSGLTDVGGLRLHLTVPSALHPGAGVIHASAWDDDAEVWRMVGQVPLPVPEAPDR